VRLTFLGTGTSFGVPQIGCACRVCRSDDPRDRRTRVGAVLETDGGTRLLIDTPPELRLQLIANGIERIDAVLFTHAHADHVHGIDDLRAVTVRGGALPMYGSAHTLDLLMSRFGYIFDEATRPLPGTSKPEGRACAIRAGEPFRVADAEVVPVSVPHGPVDVLGFRVGPVGYVTDAKRLPEATVTALAGVRVLVLNALWRTAHPTHLSIPEAVEVARRIGAERTYLTHLSHQTGHAELEAELPPEVRPAHDGLTIEVAA
jgi:phosphoribosyl 1,2-cyclic phosphate phosphodiesterase